MIDASMAFPQGAFVNDVKADLHDVNTVYAAFDNHKTGDFSPYLVRSNDRGQTWESYGRRPARSPSGVAHHSGPQMPESVLCGNGVRCLLHARRRPDWIKLPGTPTIPFRDLEIQRRENDLVGASFGRSFYVLDDYTPLRTIDDTLLAQDFSLFPMRPASCSFLIECWVAREAPKATVISSPTIHLLAPSSPTT